MTTPNFLHQATADASCFAHPLHRPLPTRSGLVLTKSKSVPPGQYSSSRTSRGGSGERKDPKGAASSWSRDELRVAPMLERVARLDPLCIGPCGLEGTLCRDPRAEEFGKQSAWYSALEPPRTKLRPALWASGVNGEASISERAGTAVLTRKRPDPEFGPVEAPKMASEALTLLRCGAVAYASSAQGPSRCPGGRPIPSDEGPTNGVRTLSLVSRSSFTACKLMSQGQ